jgi:hypothetical protein
MFQYILLAAQAAGLVANILQTKRENKIDRQGLQIQQRDLDLRMQQEQLASSQESLYNMARLRDTMASQRAIFAARGQSSAQGSNFFIGQNSISSFNEDEQARKLSLNFRQHYINVNKTLASMETTGRIHARKGRLLSEVLNTISFNSLGSFGSDGGGVNNTLQVISKGGWDTGLNTRSTPGPKGGWITGSNISNSWRDLGGKKSFSGLNG